MIVLAIIIGVIWVFLIAFSLYSSSDAIESNFNEGLMCGVFIIILTIAEISLICSISKEPKPQAIDVYRNKTELEIHSINNIPQDTVVVWKGEVYEDIQ